jgi:Domain of unknown function (DUF4282)
MPDRSSHQGLPEEWNHGSHAARGPFSTSGASDGYNAADGYDGHGASDGYGSGATGAHRARAADGFGTGPAEAYGVAAVESYGAGSGAADPFGDGNPFGPRAANPFGPAATAPFAAVTTDDGAVRLDTERPQAATGAAAPGRTADARGFLGALFDFGFTSFVTPSVIKVLYMLIVIGTVVSALVFTIIVFKASVTFGFLMLVFGDPLFILIVLAIYRIILEFFVITFRVAEDIQALRERGDLR